MSFWNIFLVVEGNAFRRVLCVRDETVCRSSSSECGLLTMSSVWCCLTVDMLAYSEVPNRKRHKAVDLPP